MPPHYQIQLITPQGIAYQGEISHALVPAEDGFVGVLAHHAPYITSSPGGRLEIREKEATEPKEFQVGVGFFEVRGNHATFLTQSVKVLGS